MWHTDYVNDNNRKAVTHVQMGHQDNINFSCHSLLSIECRRFGGVDGLAVRGTRIASAASAINCWISSWFRQTFRLLHDCSDCFRLERLPGGACTHWKAPPLHGAHPSRTSARISACTGTHGVSAR